MIVYIIKKFRDSSFSQAYVMVVGSGGSFTASTQTRSPKGQPKLI